MRARRFVGIGVFVFAVLCAALLWSRGRRGAPLEAPERDARDESAREVAALAAPRADGGAPARVEAAPASTVDAPAGARDGGPRTVTLDVVDARTRLPLPAVMLRFAPAPERPSPIAFLLPVEDLREAPADARELARASSPLTIAAPEEQGLFWVGAAGHSWQPWRFPAPGIERLELALAPTVGLSVEIVDALPTDVLHVRVYDPLVSPDERPLATARVDASRRALFAELPARELVVRLEAPWSGEVGWVLDEARPLFGASADERCVLSARDAAGARDEATLSGRVFPLVDEGPILDALVLEPVGTNPRRLSRSRRLLRAELSALMTDEGPGLAFGPLPAIVGRYRVQALPYGPARTFDVTPGANAVELDLTEFVATPLTVVSVESGELVAVDAVCWGRPAGGRALPWFENPLLFDPANPITLFLPPGPLQIDVRCAGYGTSSHAVLVDGAPLELALEPLCVVELRMPVPAGDARFTPDWLAKVVVVDALGTVLETESGMSFSMGSGTPDVTGTLSFAAEGPCRLAFPPLSDHVTFSPRTIDARPGATLEVELVPFE